ncbi:DMT family transporter [Uliginosibacterium sp. H1]|uniref:DMT family transporter n=1 Tax=Uliginosibacterium sp. H1 TaxID=3114757 RepID=UPI002E17B2C9|nr:DMT family transporter [Uliginosibacterium sp. H1]
MPAHVSSLKPTAGALPAQPGPLASTRLVGALCMLVAAAAWGGMFPVAKSALVHIDAYAMTVIRYGITAVLMALLLWQLEGRAALRTDGKLLPAFIFGSIGFAGFSLLAFNGLRHTTPTHAAVLAALMPLLTALCNAVLARSLPPMATRISIGLALAGVLLVVSHGDLHSLVSGGSAWGDLLVFLGGLSWVVYTLGARRFPGWSPLRYTTVTVLAGFLGILLVSIAAWLLDAAHLPSRESLAAITPELVYIVLIGSLAAVLSWNAGIARLGPVDGVLFINFVPVTTFAIQASRGVPITGWEVAGGVLVAAALLFNTAMQKRSARRAG